MEFKNDLGKPWKYEEGGFTVVRTSMWSPPGCHPTGCGLKLYVDADGRLDHVEGDENNPITKGRLCVRCLALKDYVYNPSRVVHPMKRDPVYRGQHDKWERCTWDDAYAIIKEKVDDIKANYGPECMAVFSGTGRSGGIMCQEMAQKVLGTPNACYTQSGFACYQPRSAACSCVLGAYYPEIDYAGGLEGTYDNPNWVCPEVLVMWGKEPLPSNGDGLWGHAVIDMMRRGASLITVDPRVNWLSTRSEIQLRVRPGTDAAMVMAWLWVIINEDLYDHDFVEKWTYGFDEFAARINDPEKGMTPERAAAICEVDVDKIYAAARRYATAKPAAIAWGLAFDQNQNGNQAGHALLALMAITGNVDVPGGQIIAEIPAAAGAEEHAAQEVADGSWEGDATDVISFGGTGGGDPDEAPDEGWEGIGLELTHKAIGYDKYPLYCENIRMAHADMMLDALLTGEPYRIRLGWIQSTNLLSPTCCAEPSKWYQGLMGIDYVISTDCFITPSIEACADLFMPLQTCAEKDDVNFTHYAASPVLVGAINKAVDVGEAKSDADILVELGNVLGSPKIAGHFKSGRDYTSAMRAVVAGTDFDGLSEEVYHQRGCNYRKYETGLLRPDRKMGFLTNTGRVELYSTAFEQNGEDPLPYYQEPAFSPAAHPDVAEKYPFVLTTGARTYAFFHSEHRQIPRLRELNPNPLLEINPDDARAVGVADGQWVEIANDFGAAKFKAKVSPIVRAGTVHAQHGWWFPEQEADAPNLYGVFQSNCNDLVPSHYNSKLGYGAPHKCMCCSVTPLEESYDADMEAIWDKFGKLVK
ncbi:molybdopterin dinucleotide binding domain-containing protein [Gordonibacter urolithinfaciens]|uniref:Molybdopterin-dependent oxidoreductase n=1 Tax=Gordonibacter urolithinfaciens TaxID=1335613 RepID=A0A6N8IFW3_9ACTN|nr:molybdopterin dinucleotide binding domain-containing protein [Gordonibacter urolithinfaciens]MVM55380.1 molybdopterin-dependent oxidoreductase [Gordonibacter urolithinfaciens]MVN14280.1 molybdopterin-dependent oxidoreductase [Gordonibacter urolithinfaciens]MVN38973.1 molybdopterin-dependent oxidoreductase [Gordonibacter urolithinfaciens]MVN55865.1 molybdopterin-dependent oxidoreductase [Gordonibacter urolithinfaciens]MVN60106.1 molybdopterin-dependent oxidoreductase [Gordonibacter urolithin